MFKINEFEYKKNHSCDNTEDCVECAKQRLKEAEYYGKTPDIHDCILVKESYGGYW